MDASEYEADQVVKGAGRKSRLPYYLYRSAETVVHILPHRAAYGVAAFVATLIAVFNPSALNGLRENLRHVVPGYSERRLRRLVRRNARNLARCWVDVMEMRYRVKDIESRLKVVNGEHFDNALNRGNGLVCVSMHFGSWEHGLVAWNFRGHQMSLLAEYLEPPELFERVAGARRAHGVNVVPIDVATMRGNDSGRARRAGASAMREIVKVLKAGGAVAIAMDRDLIGNGTPMKFFDQDAPIPIGVVDVAIRTGASILPVGLIRHRDYVEGIAFPEVEYDAEKPRDEELRRVAGVILRIFEDLIRKHPEQWHVLDPIWISRNSETAVEAHPADDVELAAR